ncbi:MAG: hypothetical protein PHO37_10670, partial [Kiritimatiellae bacterium]|nr:hypothetical protein [Kiritimatiellia bacterium]
MKHKQEFVGWAAAVFVAAASNALARSEGVPRLATAETRANAAVLSALQKPGQVFFEDDFESAASLKKYFEIRGREQGHVKLVSDPAHVHSGQGALQVTAPAKGGDSAGAGATAWFGPAGYDTVYLRLYIKFDENYNQGNLNHTGGSLAAVGGHGKWDQMGQAGIRPKGDERFNSRFEPWCDWGKLTPPGYLFLYTYWMEMRQDPDGNYWGNMLGPDEKERYIPKRGECICLEHMIKANNPGEANGELAAWIDGQLYIHY